MTKILSVIGVLAIVFVIAAQFVGPDRMNRRINPAMTFDAQAQAPQPLKAMLNRSCVDCHSDQTRWRWYGYVAPFSWLLAADVYAGRQHVNVSQWGTHPHERQANMLREMCEQVKRHEMQLWYYTLVHPAARVSDNDARTFCTWVDTERQRLASLPKTPQP